MRKHKGATIIGVVAVVGALVWMRALASWRPQVVARVRFKATQIFFSRDGQRLIVADELRDRQAFRWNGTQNLVADQVRELVDTDGFLTTFPRIWFNWQPQRLYFSWKRDQNIELEMPRAVSLKSLASTPNFPPAYSKARGEIYGQAQGVIFVWNARDGKLKKRVKFLKSAPQKVIFSPDAKRLLAYEKLPDGNGFLRCYDVQSGKMTKTVHQTTDLGAMGFSPDANLFWFVQSLGGNSGDFNVLRADNWKWLWSADCAGPVKWLPDGRIGIVGKHGFSWRRASGSRLQQVSGPFAPVSDWALSPDGNWTYSVESSGLIRRWRAR